MEWHDKKRSAKHISRIITVAILAGIAYWLYPSYRAQNPAAYKRQTAYTDTNRIRHVKVTAIQDTVTKRSDSIKTLSIEISEPLSTETPQSFSTRIHPSPKQTDSSAPTPAVLHPKHNPDYDTLKNQNNSGALHGPSAFFSHEYTIATGKTIPVTVLWAADSGAAAKHLRLITIKVDDITNHKARFMIEDPFNVLLFSQAAYSANDKILINDDRHNINISVLQITATAAVVKIESQLSESIISQLQTAN